MKQKAINFLKWMLTLLLFLSIALFLLYPLFVEQFVDHLGYPTIEYPTVEETVKEVYKNLKTGQIVIDCPTKMKVAEAEIITTRISDDLKQNLSIGLKNNPETDTLKVGTFIKAVLAGDSFDIKPINNESQVLVPGKPTEWKWSVIPKNAGEQSLFLTVSIRIFIPEYKREEMMDLNTYIRTIKVAVNSSAFWENNWQWIIENADKLGLAALGAALLTQWKRLKKWFQDKFNKP